MTRRKHGSRGRRKECSKAEGNGTAQLPLGETGDLASKTPSSLFGPSEKHPWVPRGCGHRTASQHNPSPRSDPKSAPSPLRWNGEGNSLLLEFVRRQLTPMSQKKKKNNQKFTNHCGKGIL